MEYRELIKDYELLCGWDFSATEPLLSYGKQKSYLFFYPTTQKPIFAEYQSKKGLLLSQGQFLRISRTKVDLLNIHGNTEFILYCEFLSNSTRNWQFIAGVWDEKNHKRQYAIFYNGTKETIYPSMKRRECSFKIHGYLSANGGHTPGHDACYSYASSAHSYPPYSFISAALVFKDSKINVYVNGRLDANPETNPCLFQDPTFDGGPSGADFTIAHRNYRFWENYPDSPPPPDEGFSGIIFKVDIYIKKHYEKI